MEHLQSIAAIPQIIENSIFIEELANEDLEKYPGVKSFSYYVCGLKIAGVDYTVKAVIANQNNGERYYDHELTNIEKGKLLSITPTIQKAGMDGTRLYPTSKISDYSLSCKRMTGKMHVKSNLLPAGSVVLTGSGATRHRILNMLHLRISKKARTTA